MYHDIIAQVCKKYGKAYTKEFQERMLGGTDRYISEQVVKELKLNVSVDTFEDELLRLSKEVLPTAPLQKGAGRLLQHLHDCQVPVALATNSTRDQVLAHARAKPEIFRVFHHVVTATDPDICRGKPHPDMYLAAAERFCDQPDPAQKHEKNPYQIALQCLVFEDSPVGLQAGIAAGMQVVITPHHKLEPEIMEQATMVLPDWLAFQPQLFGLPPFRNECKEHLRQCPGQGFNPPSSACDPCEPKPCPKPGPKSCPPKKCSSCKYGLTENKAVLTTMLLTIIIGILYRIW